MQRLGWLVLLLILGLFSVGCERKEGAPKSGTQPPAAGQPANPSPESGAKPPADSHPAPEQPKQDQEKK